ncbi:MAG: 23S rRNA (adenine(2503)-C(2))-methyltransferase RlmN [Clostridia bacterium]|nr:23S rRNA (adenine(2503)-C(2))-methyltransferase RlmN [Clostridia bacterium]
MENRADLLSMTANELKQFVIGLGEPAFRSGQIMQWLCKGAAFSEMTNLSASLREKLSAQAVLHYPVIEGRYASRLDSTVKYLFRLSDGQLIESVLMEYEHGLSICVSSQAGCRMGCRFCASTLGGKVRDLLPSEILGQIIVAQKDAGKRISNIVLMGIGEPLDNYDHVIRFLRLVSAPEGLNIGCRHISLSTCGLVPAIYRLANEDLPITLSISLHAYDDEVRSRIMPVNRAYNIDRLLTACRDYFDQTGRRISFEYTLIAGENDSTDGATELARLLKRYLEKRPFHVNLIPVNPVKERGYAASGKRSVRAFCETLERLGVNATVRRTLGEDINAACGQLRHTAGQDTE